MDYPRRTKKALESAIISQHPQRLLEVFQLSIDSRLQKIGEPGKQNPQTFTVDGKDCGNLLSALVDLNAATEVINDYRNGTAFVIRVESHPIAPKLLL